MKNTLMILLLLMSMIFASCGMDSDTPSSLRTSGGGDIAPVTAGGTVRVKPASFGMYDSYINPHPESRRTSLYRLYQKDGRNYVYQSNGAEELKLHMNVGETAVELILYKERISTSTVGDFKYYEFVDGEYRLVETTLNEFRAIQQGDDESSAQLVFNMKRVTEKGTEDVEFKLTVNGENLVYSQMIQTADEEEPQEVTSDVTVEKINVDEVMEYGTYINDVMMEKSACKRVTAGNIVGITTYTTDAARSLEYRKCYWDLYDKVVRDFVQAHKDAVIAGDARGEKCMSDAFNAIKDDLKNGKENCQTRFGN